MSSASSDVLQPETPLKLSFWSFQVYGWFIGGCCLFLSGLTHASVGISLLRNALFTVLAFGLSLGLRRLYDRLRPSPAPTRLLGVLLCSYGAAVLAGLVVNPVTFSALGYDMFAHPWPRLFAGVFNFALVFALWSALYLTFWPTPVAGAARPGPAPLQDPEAFSYWSRLAVGSGKQLRLLRADEIDYVQAQGDYVALQAGGKTYLLRETMHTLESHLNPARFFRIHRSTIVNVDRIETLRPHRNGEYFVSLQDGTALRSSRTYRDALRARFGPHL